jgi:hypothetical protein
MDKNNQGITKAKNHGAERSKFKIRLRNQFLLTEKLHIR